MRKFLLVIFLLFLNFSFVNAESNFENDYTLIDCVNGDNGTGVAFDSTKPYATLKVGIENTINYINSNVNFVGNDETASGKVFNIKVNCSFYDIFNPVINLNYNGVNYNNELIIEGNGDNSLVFKDTSFQLSYGAGNITFKNAIFLNEDKPYFYDYVFPSDSQKRSPFSNGIRIINSYVKLKNGNNIGNYDTYKLYYYKNPYAPSPNYIYPYHYVNHQMIENSIIDIEISDDYVFRAPVSLKNSKVNFSNSGSTGSYNISILEDGNTRINTHLNYGVFTSNEIDFGGNNFTIENTVNLAFLNNKFTNFVDFNLGGVGIFINNFFDNNASIDISNFHNLYNNVFAGAFTDSYDIYNHRKNYALNNVGNKGIGWIYKRLRDNKYFNIDINAASLYKEVTGQDLVNGLSDIYVIFNY